MSAIVAGHTETNKISNIEPRANNKFHHIMKFKAVVKDYLYESFIHCMANLFSICMMNTYREIQSHTNTNLCVCVCLWILTHLYGHYHRLCWQFKNIQISKWCLIKWQAKEWKSFNSILKCWCIRMEWHDKILGCNGNITTWCRVPFVCFALKYWRWALRFNHVRLSVHSSIFIRFSSFNSFAH